MTDLSPRFTLHCGECGTPGTSFTAKRLPADGTPGRRQWVAVMECAACGTFTSALRPRQPYGAAA